MIDFFASLYLEDKADSMSPITAIALYDEFRELTPPGEKGAEMFVPDQAGTIVPNNQLGMGQPVTVNFNINTVDARGFNELLVNSRGTIVNMINNAVNEKGKMAII